MPRVKSERADAQKAAILRAVKDAPVDQRTHQDYIHGEVKVSDPQLGYLLNMLLKDERLFLDHYLGAGKGDKPGKVYAQYKIGTKGRRWLASNKPTDRPKATKVDEPKDDRVNDIERAHAEAIGMGRRLYGG
jgi:hypothetical protein